MAKKTKDEVPNPNNISNRDILQRLNFLYQAGTYLSTLPGEPSSSATRGIQKRRKTRAKKHEKPTGSILSSDIARTYMATMRSVGQRTVVKLDPSVKRTLCQSCNSILIPGKTATVRVKSSSSHGHVVTYTCTTCKSSRRIPAPPVLTEVGSDGKADGQPEPHSTAADGMEALEPGERMIVEAESLEDTQSVVHSQTKKGGKSRRSVPARLPSFFERNIGHVVFRGNEKVQETTE